jgi:hypothetical protein
MRAMVLALALLAGLKIWAQDSVYRSATEQALISAYRDRAVTACRKEPQRDGRGYALAPFPIDWANAAETRLVIGDSRLSVYPWEVDHEHWNARYRSAYLILSSPTGLDCTYDLAAGTARIYRT